MTKGSDFTVFLIAKDVRRSVTFSLAEHAISVRDGDGSPVFDVTLTFNDAGECRLKVKEQERELWQAYVSRQLAAPGAPPFLSTPIFLQLCGKAAGAREAIQ